MTSPEELYWTKVAALGQVAGAIATFAAVVVSLYLARRGRVPRLHLRVGERLVISPGAPDLKLLMFSVRNRGERPVYVRQLGWRTGWLRWGPGWLRRQFAVQLSGAIGLGKDPPYQIEPGEEVSTYVAMEHVLDNCRERAGPFFSRVGPFGRHRATAVWGYVVTADGYTIRARPEDDFVKSVVAAERSALELRAKA